MGANRAATAAADPPLLPPGMRSRSWGLCVAPHAECSVELPMAMSPRPRADDPEEVLSQDEVLDNAPVKRGGAFLVPRVVDG